MCTQTTIDVNARGMQVELVDNWHPRWREVLDAIDFVGQRQSLHVDPDGWLSARQNLLVAFVDDAVAGHLCFRVEPARGARVAAKLESIEVQPGFAREEVQTILLLAAEKRAHVLRCRQWST